MSKDNVEYKEYTSEDNLTADIIKNQDELLKYRRIGTLEECREAMEKQKAKKPNNIKNSVIGIMYGYCPTCRRQINVNSSVSYCIGCGQKLDWESEVNRC